ncbi:hypothetical protein BOX15_Mlig004071g7 [Macrostomum lignano]|uniref:Uncharacterized protein n=1 Tax=Macrostomum lignano TaxID=282301 RepID=A0A267DAK2_9PLAT|nr:hypothetical protein BOX15_Mlig010665g1 [Macrostomum lignano]PAA48647.1 hypothetical protein BOX15_Mlig004071g2 [Macrostomum lignano]PAA76379.1 hypothetical protein BOX15_Mlig004071g7 [Macrostomum lignano]
MSINSEKQQLVSGYARAALFCAVFSFVCVLLSFVTPFWLQSWPRVHTPMDRLGLWEFCLDGLVHRLDPEMRSYFGCWWSFAPEFYPIRNYLMPPWFRFVQFCITFGLMLHIGALILCVIYVVRCVNNPERRALLSQVLAYAMLFIGTLLGVGIIVFGSKCLDPYWLPNPELNWPSWSFGLAVLSVIFCFFTACFMVPQVKLDRELMIQREYAFPMSAGKSTDELMMPTPPGRSLSSVI